MKKLEITEGINQNKTTTNVKKVELMSNKEIEIHKTNKIHDQYYPKLPTNMSETTLIGFRKRLANYKRTNE